MNKGDRVEHKTGTLGTVNRVDQQWVFVVWDGMSVAMPHKEDWLTKIEEGGEHEQQPSH